MNTCKTEIILHHIFTSSSHNYFTREKFDVGQSSTMEHDFISCKENKGFEGDRFEHSKYPITFFSLEVAKDLCNSLELGLDLKLFRRNVIISGVNLGELVGKRFTIGDIEFEGITHCPPCVWMNAVMKKGAYALMRGRGGLRVKVIKGGVLGLGKMILATDKALNKNPLEALSKPSIP